MTELHLFQRYPELARALSVCPLGTYPTRLERLSGPDLPAELWIKRDDLSGPVYGGNKVRKLEFILAEAQTRGATRIVTGGGIGSNHLLATGIYAQQLGIPVTGIVADQPMNRYVKKNLLAGSAVGIRYAVTSMPLAPVTLARVLLQSKVAGEHPVWLAMGGSTPLGTLGFVNAAFELKAQLAEQQIATPRRIYVPLGSGGTAAGLALGVALAGLDCEIIGVIVVPGAFASRTLLGRLCRQTYRLLQRYLPALPSYRGDQVRLSLRGNAIGKGYGHPTAAGLAAADRFAALGIELDWTYSAKTMATLLAEERQRADGPVLFWHTYSGTDLSPLLARADRSLLPPRLVKQMDSASDPVVFSG